VIVYGVWVSLVSYFMYGKSSWIEYDGCGVFV